MPRGQLYRNIASGDRARQRMQVTGLTPNGYRLWADPETGELRRGYPDYDKVLARVRERTRKAAHSKASRIHITKPRSRLWIAESDKPKMRRLYPSGTRAELMAAFPGRTWEAIQGKARAWRIYRDRPNLNPRGQPIVDAILAEARRQNLSLRDLAALAHSSFFQRKHRTLTRSSWIVILRAVKGLGGTIRARWH